MPVLAEPKQNVVFANAKPKEKPYVIADGKGLYLVVNPDGGKLWIFRFRFDGVRKKLSIKGGFPSVGVKQAREEADRFRAMVSRGEDPSKIRKMGREEDARKVEEEREEQARQANTFEKVAREWFAKVSAELDPTSAQRTLRRLDRDIFPWIGSRPLVALRAPDLLEALRRVEDRGAKETAHRILGVCSQICRFAVASGIIESDPTRDLKGALAKPKEKHFAALTDPAQVAALLRAVEGYQGNLETRIALKLGIMTFVRPGNLRMAEWSEFQDLDNPEAAVWRIPGDKMKVKTTKPFLVPLAPEVVALLEQLRPLTGGGRYLFPSPRVNSRPLSNNTINAALRRMGYDSDEMTGHGVRAMARTLSHEVLGFAPEVIEEQLAHGKVGPLRDAYDRTTHLPERRRLMREWAKYLEGLKGEVGNE